MTRLAARVTASPTSRSLVASAVLLALGACRSGGDELEVETLGAWETFVAHSGDLKLSGVACGDVLADVPGDEAVAVGERGVVVLARRDDDGFASEVVVETGGELLQVAVGELDAAAPGAEFVAVGVLTGGEDDGAEGVAWLFRRGTNGLERLELFRTSALLHAVVIADIDPASAGNEVALAGFTREVVLLRRGGDGVFAARTIGALPGNAKGMTATASGLAVACDDGTLVHFARGEGDGTWPVRETWASDAPLARIAARGDELLVCGNGGTLSLQACSPNGAFRRETRCLNAPDRLRGAVFADVVSEAEGDEAATAGYDGRIHVVRLIRWPVADDVVPESAGLANYRVEVEVVGADTAKLHHLASGRFQGLGTALVTAGYSGRVLVIRRSAEER